MWRSSIGSKRSLSAGLPATLHHEIEDHATPAGGQIGFVAVFDAATAFDDDIGMGLEQAYQLLAGKGAPLALGDDAFDQ